METLKKYKVSIFGESYTLVSDEREEHVLLSAQQIDCLMRDLAEKTGLADTKRIAVLAALQVACEFKNTYALLEESERRGLELIARLDQELSSLGMEVF